MDDLVGYVATGVVSLIVGALLFYLQPKAKLVYWSPHTFLFNLPGEKARVALQTDALTVQNLGRMTAERIEVIFDRRPDFFQFSPALTYQEEVAPAGGAFTLRVASLGHNEFFTLQLLSYTAVPRVLNIRSDAGRANAITFQLARVYPKWLLVTTLVALVAGTGFCAYWLVRAIVFVSKGIGIA